MALIVVSVCVVFSPWRGRLGSNERAVKGNEADGSALSALLEHQEKTSGRALPEVLEVYMR
jgi:hypothetical protein